MGGGGSKKKDEEDALPNLYDEKRRTNVAKELVETERSYVKSLKTLCEIFLLPLKESAASSNPILTSNEVKDIFGIIEVIVNFHATLLTDLDERMKKWDASTCMGDIFAKNNAFFKMISTYVNGYNIALMTYYQCKNKNKAFCQFLDKAATSTPGMLDLQSYLIMPVQRIPRYVLLLTELVKYSNHKHPGYQSLSESLEGVKRVAEFVNEEKKNAESALKMLHIQENLVGKRTRHILEPTRKYYGEGTFTWINSRRKEPRPLQYFLFSDCIMLATPEKSFFQSTPDKLKLKIMEPLVSVDIQEDTEQQGSKKSKFDIKTSRKVFTVHCDPEVDLDEWIEVFYWIRSGCGPRYEKVNAEAQKRNFTRADTLEHINSKKLSTKSDTQVDTKAKPQASAKSTTTSPPPPSTPAKAPASPSPSAASPPAATAPPASPKPAAAPPSPAIPKAAATPPPAAKPAAPSAPPAKNAPPPPAAASPPTPAKTAPPPATPTTPKSAPAKQPADSKGKPESAPAKQPADTKGKPEDPKPPRPAGPPPPIKDSAKKPAESPSSSAANQPLERRPSFTTSVSAFFGMKSDASPSPSPTPSPRTAPTTNSPASPRTNPPPPANASAAKPSAPAKK